MYTKYKYDELEVRSKVERILHIGIPMNLKTFLLRQFCQKTLHFPQLF